MKKILYSLLVMSLALGFGSCSGDDDDELRADPSFNPVVGEWVGEGSKTNEKYAFTADFKCQKYGRESQTKPWGLVSESPYLINSKYIKIGNNGKIIYLLRNNNNELGIMFEENKFNTYYKEFL
jgi:hypothetical protein